MRKERELYVDEFMLVECQNKIEFASFLKHLLELNLNDTMLSST